MTSSGTYGRAVQTSPSSFTAPPSAVTVWVTSAVLPTSAAVPVRSCAGVRMWRRAIGRTKPNSSPALTRKTMTATTASAPASSAIAPNSAPMANGARNRLSDMTSPTAKITAMRTQIIHASIVLWKHICPCDEARGRTAQVSSARA